MRLETNKKYRLILDLLYNRYSGDKFKVDLWLHTRNYKLGGERPIEYKNLGAVLDIVKAMIRDTK